jgi:hypothetical protein
LFGYEQPTVRRELHGRRIHQATDYLRAREVGPERCGTSRRVGEERQNTHDRS